MNLEEMQDEMRMELEKVKKDTKHTFRSQDPLKNEYGSIPEPKWDFWLWLFVGGFVTYVIIILLVEGLK